MLLYCLCARCLRMCSVCVCGVMENASVLSLHADRHTHTHNMYTHSCCDRLIDRGLAQVRQFIGFVSFCTKLAPQGRKRSPSCPVLTRTRTHTHGVSGSSSDSALLSTAASSSTWCGSELVPAPQRTACNVNAEYGAKRYSRSSRKPGTRLLTRFT